MAVTWLVVLSPSGVVDHADGKSEQDIGDGGGL